MIQWGWLSKHERDRDDGILAELLRHISGTLRGRRSTVNEEVNVHRGISHLVELLNGPASKDDKVDRQTLIVTQNRNTK